MSDNKALNVIFMGTPDFAAIALHAILESQHNVVGVYTQPPRPKGRGKAVQHSAVHSLAAAHAIPVFTPKSLKSKEAQEQFATMVNETCADVGVVAAYGLILPKAVLDAPRHGCLNIHGSLLPRWRGAAPIQRAIEAGDKQSGITIMQMNEGLDTGPMIMEQATPITQQTTAQDLHDSLADIGGHLIVKTLDILAHENRLCHTVQDSSKATYASMLNKEEGQIDWSQSAAIIERKIRAFTPWPGTYSFFDDGKRIKILKVTLLQNQTDANTGVILKGGMIACGNGTLLGLDLVQPENKKPMSLKAAMNGGYLNIGDRLT